MEKSKKKSLTEEKIPKGKKSKVTIVEDTKSVSSHAKSVDKIKPVNKQSNLFDFGIKSDGNSQAIKTIKNSDMPPLPKDKEIFIYSWNVAGLRSVIKKEGWSKFLKQENIDILCLNETKIDENILEKENFSNLLGPSYSSYFNCCKTKKGYSGTAIFTKYAPLNVTYGISIKKHDDEGRVITMEFDSFYLVATYIPNAGEGLKRIDYRVKEWDVDFQNYLNNLKKLKTVIWAGDINVAHNEIDIHSPKTNLKSAGFTIEERNSFSSFLEKGWIDTFRFRNPEAVCYSYWSFFGQMRDKNKGWRLDYFVVDTEGNKSVENSEILNSYTGSDHCPIKLTLKQNL